MRANPSPAYAIETDPVSKIKPNKAGEMCVQLGELSSFLEDASSISNSHIRWLATACSTSASISIALYWPPKAPHKAHTYTDTCTYT